jgi:Fe-S-cluster containining protein
MNLQPHFDKYLALVGQVDAVFNQVQEAYQDCVTCKLGCSDCCHAVFDLTLIEALYLKTQFDAVFGPEDADKIIERANFADRKVHRLKRNAQKEYQEGKSEDSILHEMAAERIRCPLLNDDERCELYPHRPITCRLYGIPTAIGGKSHTCGISGFKKGISYPTVKLENIQSKLYELSMDLATDLKSKYPKLGEMLVPVSMALLTEYSASYLGVAGTDPEDDSQGETP